MQLRRFVAEDYEETEELIATVTMADGHAPIGEHKSLNRSNHQIVPGLVGELDGRIIAYSVLQEWGTSEWGAEVAVHPMHRQRPIFRELISATTDLVVARGGRALRVWAFHPGLAGTLVDLGFQPERELRELRRVLPVGTAASWPAGFEVDTFRVGRDEEDWLRVNNDAFVWHPENGSWTAEILNERIAQSWFDPSGFLVARRDGEMAGFCWTKMHKKQLGEIYIIGVGPRFQGKGLGRALLINGLEYLTKAGATTASLYVDADNHKANDLYADLGFHLHHVDRAFRRLTSR